MIETPPVDTRRERAAPKMKAHLLRFLAARCRNQKVDVELSPDFHLDDRGLTFHREHFVDSPGIQPSSPNYTNVEIVAVLEDSDGHASVLWEGTDPVTDLRFRIAWFAWFDGATMTRILATGHEVIDIWQR